jgi:hypothetical protein
VRYLNASNRELGDHFLTNHDSKHGVAESVATSLYLPRVENFSFCMICSSQALRDIFSVT